MADLLNVSFVDLDAEFVKRNGDISAYLETHGYDSYAEAERERLFGSGQRVSDVADRGAIVGLHDVPK